MGKWIVAQDDEERKVLESIKSKGDSLGVPLRFLGDEEIKLVPEVRTKHVLLSPETGIVDSHQLMAFLEVCRLIYIFLG